MDIEGAENLDAALARWVTGEADASATRDAVRATLARHSASAVLVPADTRDVDERDHASDHAPPSTPTELGDRRLAIAMAERARGRRVLVTKGDPVLDELRSIRRTATPLEWMASEPLPRDATLIAIGRDAASMNDALAIVPRIARALAALAAADEASGASARQIHRLKNLIAGTIANLEYAHSLLASSGPTEDGRPRDDLRVALGYALAGARAMATPMDELQRLDGLRPIKIP